jgi:hypothetical protein
LENYQGAAKLAALDRHYHLALAYQLKALALATLEFGFDAEKHPENHCLDLSKETDEKNSNSDITVTKSSNKSTNHGASSGCLYEHKTRSADFSDISNVTNTAKDRNSNPLITNYGEEFKAHVTNVNPSCIPVQQIESNSYFGNGSTNNKTKLNENIGISSNLVNEIVNTEVTVNVSSCTENTALYVKDMDGTAANRMEKESLISGTTGAEENILNGEDQSDMTIVPQNFNYENKIVKESKTGKVSEFSTEVENGNQRNFKTDLLYNSENKSETDQFVEGNNAPKDKSRVEFSDRICVQRNEDLKPNSELSSMHCSTGMMTTESDKEESLNLEVSEQETNLLAKPSDRLSSKTHLSPTEEEVETSSSVSTPESLISTNVNDSEMHAFAVQGGTEQMSEGRHLTSPDSSASLLVSEEQSPQSREPFLPHVNENGSQNAGLNLIPINENGNVQNSDISHDVGEENSNKCEKQLMSNLTPTGKCESFVQINQETVLRNSDVNSRFLNDGAELQRNSDTVTPAVESTIVSVIKESGKKEGANNEERNMENRTAGLNDQENTAKNELIVTPDTSNGTAGNVYALNKTFTCNDPHRIFENNDVFDTDDCRQIMRSDCSNCNQILNLPVESPCSKDSYNLHTGHSVAEEKLASCSKKGIENNVIKTPTTLSEMDSEPTVRALEINVSCTKQLSSTKIDLENCNNECKVSSSDRDFLSPEKTLDDGVSMKSTDVFNNVFSENTKPEQTDLISPSTASDTAPSKIIYGNSTQQAGAADESDTDKCKDMVGQAAAVVEYYVSVMEEDSHAMMSRLLQQVCLLYAN